MPILSAKDSLGQVMRAGNRVAVPMNPDGRPDETIWVGGALLGFDPWRHPTMARVLLHAYGDAGTIDAPAALCRRLGARDEIQVRAASICSRASTSSSTTLARRPASVVLSAARREVSRVRRH